MQAVIRQLVPADAAAYVALRCEMLEDSPWAFAASLEDDFSVREAVVAERLEGPGHAIVGAWMEGRLVGAVGLHQNHHRKMAHRVYIWGVYVMPAWRGRGLAQEMMESALAVARSWEGVVSVGLSASEKSVEALRLYERLGFVRWGVEPRAVLLDGRWYDEVHMVRMLDE